MLAFQRILIGSVDYIFAELQHYREVCGISDITVLEDGENNTGEQLN